MNNINYSNKIKIFEQILEHKEFENVPADDRKLILYIVKELYKNDCIDDRTKFLVNCFIMGDDLENMPGYTGTVSFKDILRDEMCE